MSPPLDATQRRALMSHPAGWMATALGAGLAPRAPGTAGSLVALLPWWFLLRGLQPHWYLAVLAVGFVLGVWACDVSGKRIGVHDHGALVWDEVIGMWIALFAAPMGWPWMLAGFVLFRLFDIWKPWPVSLADRRVRGGLGVMLDDVIAGVYALIVLQLAAAVLYRV
ncbi:MAG: phosphatidylglycerophosphatase A family protein [Rhodanobacteraceae bacterium]